MAAVLGRGVSLGRLGPIPIRVDPSLFVILGLIRYTDGVTLNEMLIWIGVAAFCIFVHELGHAVAFLGYKRKPSILLYGFGGVTSAEGDMTPWSNLVTSLAGPFAGFALGVLILLEGAYVGVDGGTLAHVAYRDGVFACFGFGILNLLPILPLDGGAALAAFLRAVQGPKGEQTARYVSIGAATLLAVAGWKLGQTFAGLFGLMFAVQNYQELKRHRDGPQREVMQAAYDALYQRRPADAVEGSRQVLAGKAPVPLKEIAAETIVWAELARGDVAAARTALGERPARHVTDHRSVRRLPEAAVALAEGAGRQVIGVLVACLDEGELGPPHILFPLLERAGVLPDLWSRLGQQGRETLQRLNASRE